MVPSWDDFIEQANHLSPRKRKERCMTYLMKDGNLRVPCGRYGSDTYECAQVAYRIEYLTAADKLITAKGLDYAMSLVVNSHDDVAYIIRNYGGYKYR